MSNIPKILHFIWFGNHRCPYNIINTWKEDGWEIKVWRTEIENKETDVLISSLGDFKLMKLIDTTGKYNQKSDILRLYLLYRFGGVYCDVDIVKFNIEPHPTLTQFVDTISKNQSDFYATWEKRGCVSNSILISSQHNSTVKYLLDGFDGLNFVDANGKWKSVARTTGPYYITNKLQEHGYKLDWILNYHIVNFGQRWSKIISRKIDGEYKFIPDIEMKHMRKNKDLKYNPVISEILGFQLWMGGKGVDYDLLDNDIQTHIVGNVYKYISYIGLR
jgi:hypothetical protein